MKKLIFIKLFLLGLFTNALADTKYSTSNLSAGEKLYVMTGNSSLLAEILQTQ